MSMHLILFDEPERWRALLPFTHTRPVADIRCGIYTGAERWECLLEQPLSRLTEGYLQEVYPLQTGSDNLYLNSGVIGCPHLAQAATLLQPGEKLLQDNTLLAFRSPETFRTAQELYDYPATERIDYSGEALLWLHHPWDIFSHNAAVVQSDFEWLCRARSGAPLPEGVLARGAENIFIELGAVIAPGVVINATNGPVYIGKDTEVMEGCLIRGPFALCSQGVLKMGAKVYGGTTIGPGCKVGGEVNNVVFFANSNKGHDGFLGNAVIGEWCNLGADTNCSNLKNNYDEVKVWSEDQQQLLSTGLTFCGLLMADHAKCGINTMFNTGTVVGVSANVFGAGFPEKFVPSFSWGDGGAHTQTYRPDKALATADRMMGRRGQTLSDAWKLVYQEIFDRTADQRNPVQA